MIERILIETEKIDVALETNSYDMHRRVKFSVLRQCDSITNGKGLRGKYRFEATNGYRIYTAAGIEITQEYCFIGGSMEKIGQVYYFDTSSAIRELKKVCVEAFRQFELSGFKFSIV